MNTRSPTSSRAFSHSFPRFFASKKAGGIVLVACTLLSLLVANSPAGGSYLAFWHRDLAGMSVEHWINDGLMAVFFLMVGLELERELYNGELSDFRNALLPIVAAVGGICVPALLHFALNAGSSTQGGMGIPMATDIAFALGVLALLGSHVPASLKIFLTALAVIDDLGAILVTALCHTTGLQAVYLIGALRGRTTRNRLPIGSSICCMRRPPSSSSRCSRWRIQESSSAPTGPRTWHRRTAWASLAGWCWASRSASSCSVSQR